MRIWSDCLDLKRRTGLTGFLGCVSTVLTWIDKRMMRVKRIKADFSFVVCVFVEMWQCNVSIKENLKLIIQPS